MRTRAHVLLDRILSAGRPSLSADVDGGDSLAARALRSFEASAEELRGLLLTKLEADAAYIGLSQGLCGDEQDMEAMFGTDRRMWKAAARASRKLARYK